MHDLQEVTIPVGGKPPAQTLISHYYQPVGAISRFVELFWYWQKPDPLRGIECVLPTGTVELVIDLDSCRVTDSVVSGVKSKPVIITRGNNYQKTCRLLGIHFKPGGAFPFLPFPLHDLHNIDITLADLWGKQEAGNLLSMIHETDTIPAKFTVLEQWLLNHLFHPLCHQPAVTLATSELQTGLNMPMKSLAAKVNLSQKHFIRLFQWETGFAPKLFARICRFQKVLDMVAHYGMRDWTEVAMTCGYYDQSHFNHEFQEFSGVTPSTYMDIRTPHRNHIPVIN